MNKQLAIDHEVTTRIELPHGWTEAVLIDLVAHAPNSMTDGPFGSKLKSAHYVSEGVRVIRLGNLGVGEFKDADRSFVSHDHAATLARHWVEAGDLLIAALAEPVGRCCQVPVGILPALVKADCIRYKPHPEIEPKFVLHWLNSPQGRKIAEGHAHGVGRLRINMQAMRRLPVRLAPLPEQRRIVAEIEKQFTRLDAAVANLERVRANLKRARASILKAAVEGRLVPTEAELARAEGRDYEPASVLLERILDERERKHAETSDKKKYKPPVEPSVNALAELPEGWTWASLESITSPVRVICYGILMPKEDIPGGIPYVKVRDMRSGRLDVSRLQRTSPAIAEKYARSSLKAGDLLLAIRGTYGRVVEAPPDLEGGNITQDSARLDLHQQLNRRYIAQYLLSPPAQNYFKRVARGVAVKGVNIGDVRPTPVALPPSSEQLRIEVEVERRLSVLDAVEQIVETNLARCARLRQSILKRAFEGKLVPQDPNDEPASELLARIQAEAKATKKSPAKKTTRRARTRTPA